MKRKVEVIIFRQQRLGIIKMTLLTITQICKKLVVRMSWVHRWIQNGHFPEPYIDGSYGRKWLESDIDAWLDNIKADKNVYEFRRDKAS